MEKKPYLLGLTGGIACGKTTATKHLEKLGACIIDADEISRELTAKNGEALPAIRETFGDGVFRADGELDRRALGAVVFGDAAQKRALEGILHPMVQHVMLKKIDQAAENGEPICVLSVPLLYETAMDAMCDSVWVMSLTGEAQIIRLMNRDRLTRAEALSRIESQMPVEEKERRAQCVFHTDKPEAETLRELEHKYKELLRSLK